MPSTLARWQRKWSHWPAQLGSSFDRMILGHGLTTPCHRVPTQNAVQSHAHYTRLLVGIGHPLLGR